MRDIVNHYMFLTPGSSARLPRAALSALAAKSWRHPGTGLPVRFGVSTLERWYYLARKAADPVASLRERMRGTAGRFPSVAPRVIELLTAQYRRHPGWSVQLHWDNLRTALASEADVSMPSYPSQRRFMRAGGMVRRSRPKTNTEGALAARERLEQLEVRSYEVGHVAGLWHLDFHHGKHRVLTRAGQWVKPMLLAVMDDRSRLVCHLQWYGGESAHSLAHGLQQAFMKRNLPHARLDDRQRCGHAGRRDHQRAGHRGHRAPDHLAL